MRAVLSQDVSGAPVRVFVARLSGLSVFDPLGDRVGRVRDVVVIPRGERRPRAVGLVVEVPGRRRIFVPMTRVTSMDAGQVITTGLLNMRRFEQREAEVLVLTDLLDRTVRVREQPADLLVEAVVEDVAMELQRNRDWEVTRVFVRHTGPGGARRSALGRRRGTTALVDYHDVTGLFGTQAEQSASLLAASLEEMKAADIADLLRDMTDKRRLELAAELDDERLADVLQELPEDVQVQVLSALGRERAADVLEAMDPDDAADLLGELSTDQREQFLRLMEPEEARDVRRLLAYEDDTAGGLMTTEPVILPPEATVAHALATVRRAELPTTLAAAVFVCRPPTETPTGRLLGMVHLQRLLREAPHEAIGGLLDAEIEPLGVDTPLVVLTRRLATYDLVSLPVTDAAGRLLGVVTVDDVLDHILPDDWREQDDETAGPISGPITGALPATRPAGATRAPGRDGRAPRG
jgi:flagellar motility protein MotE (MotC chaperone)/sporulation protein YlmC with PRC-barrel domain